jgi:hypothetical protein
MRTAISVLVPLVLVSSLFGCRNRGKDVQEGLVDTGTEDTSIEDTGEEEDPGTTVFTLEEDVVWEVDQVVGGVWYVPEGVTLIVRAGCRSPSCRERAWWWMAPCCWRGPRRAR